jgi:hypothetical protein
LASSTRRLVMCSPVASPWLWMMRFMEWAPPGQRPTGTGIEVKGNAQDWRIRMFSGLHRPGHERRPCCTDWIRQPWNRQNAGRASHPQLQPQQCRLGIH